MKKCTLLAALMLFPVISASADTARILEQKQGSITFVVDENLPKPENKYIVPVLTESERRERLGIKYYSLDNSYIAASFCNTRMSTADAPFFTGMVQAFADHRPVSLSPDVIWMLISQAFSHEVNADPERFRDKFVDFDGKVDLIVETDQALYSPDFDWTGTIDGFAEKIDSGTKSDVARLLTADFTTTGTVERMASEIVLMETTQAFFEFIVMKLGCGIPSITLTGTPDDWQAVLDKTDRLQQLGAGSWAQDLKPVLEQFVQAAEGNPDQAFWQDIVMKNTAESLRGGNCSLEAPTSLDGWFLKLLPYDRMGKRTPEKVAHNSGNFLPEMASVPVLYVEIDRLSGKVIESISLKLSGGIAGYSVDESGCISFPIGWAVNRSDSDERTERFRKEAETGMSLRISRVPEELRSVIHYKSLELIFTDKVEIPLWMDSLEIDMLTVKGRITPEERKELERRFGKHIVIMEPEVTSVTLQDGYPLITVDGNIVEISRDRLAEFDFESDAENVEKIAALLDMDPETIKSVTNYVDITSTTIWGTRGRNGWIDVRKVKPHKRRFRLWGRSGSK